MKDYDELEPNDEHIRENEIESNQNNNYVNEYQNQTYVHNNSGRNLIILILVFTVFFISNPSMNDFSEYYVENYTFDNDNNTLSDNAINMLAMEVVNMYYERDNYYFFSIYEIPFEKNGDKFIGIFKKFIKI